MAPNDGNGDEQSVYLTLGDGDFSYSVDLTRYLAGSGSRNGQKSINKVIATGIDTLDELEDKYRDSPSLLNELKSHGRKNETPLVEVRHGVNAVISPTTGLQDENSSKIPRAHHVIFNHPHLGREDAARHKRFLAHFLYSADTYWMKSHGGVLHLTLVRGQYERWDCEASAERHGLVQLGRHPFRPPPVDETPRYQLRRHQTGKSFASRAIGGSETFTFGRKQDSGNYVATHLPWQHQGERTHGHLQSEPRFACGQCDRVFREERSLNNHCRSVHLSDEARKRKRTDVLRCILCKEQGVDRTFRHEQALTDHMRAKHTGDHLTIVPDWAAEKHHKVHVDEEGVHGRMARDTCNTRDHPSKLQSCAICGFEYSNLTDEDANKHLAELVPSHYHIRTLHRSSPSNKMARDRASLSCSFCGKEFDDSRAKLQHENFCSSRTHETNGIFLQT